MNEKNIPVEDQEVEIDLARLFYYLLKRWKSLFVAGIIGAVLAAGITLVQAPQYESNSTLYVLSKSTSITSVADLQLGSELTSDYAEIATSKPVIDTVIEKLKKKEDIKLTREEVKEMVTVSNKTDTRMLVITVTSDDPDLSYKLADALTTASVNQMASITQTDKPTIVEEPEVADKPIDNGLYKHIAIGIVIGLVLLAGLYTVSFVMNDEIKTEQDVESFLQVSVLGTIPVDKELKALAKREKKEAKRRNKTGK